MLKSKILQYKLYSALSFYNNYSMHPFEKIFMVVATNISNGNNVQHVSDVHFISMPIAF